MQAVLVENWVVYTYWSRAAHRFQATVVELYDDSPHDLTAAQLVFGSHNATMSSYRPVDLEVRAHRMPPSNMIFVSMSNALCILAHDMDHLSLSCMPGYRSASAYKRQAD